MLVSAISAVSGQNLRSQNPNYGKMLASRTEGLEFQSNYRTNALNVLPNKDENNVFDSINQWKAFCHRQILGGKLDVIA